MRWQFDAGYTTTGLPALVGFRCIPLPLGMSPALMLLACTTLRWLVICVFRVACDFVSRLGGWDTYFFLKERLVETFLGGPRFRGCGAKATTWILSPSVVAHVSRLGDARRRVQAQVRTPPSDQLHERAT